MSFSPLALAERVIGAADREHPADRVLRQALQSRHGRTPDQAARTSAAVFAYYRWLGWLNQGRRISEQLQQALELAAAFAAQSQAFSDSDLMTRAVPAWVGQEVALSPAWVRTLQAEPLLWLRARPGKGLALSKTLGHCAPFGEGPLADTLRYQGRADLFLTKAFHAGAFELQDISSQVVSLVCAPSPGQTWWDACAGEGGKMLHLSDLMGNQGLIWASDRAAWRLRHLKRRAARARAFNYRSVAWDGGVGPPMKAKCDGVLVDAPCSGIGTWQRNPHARWTTTPQDVRELSQLQQRLLRHVTASVKPGGKLVYAGCTLARAETEEVVEVFESAHPDFERLEFPNPLAPDARSEARLVLWPQQFGGNGMFIAAWRRQ